MANRRKVDRGTRVRDAIDRTRRAGAVLLRVLAFAVLSAALVGGGYAAYVFATESPRFALTPPVVRGNERVAASELLLLSGLAEGQNIFLADTGAAEEQIRAHPWIRAAHVQRHFPQAVTVAVLERTAVALVHVDNLYLVDSEGEVFKRWAPGDPVDLPVVTGVPREVWAERPDDARASLLEALSALAAWNATPLARRAPPAEVHVTAAEGVTLYAGGSELVVKLGHDDVDVKLQRLQRVLAEAGARGQRLEVVRLDNRTRPGWIAARPREAAQGRGSERTF